MEFRSPDQISQNSASMRQGPDFGDRPAGVINADKTNGSSAPISVHPPLSFRSPQSVRYYPVANLLPVQDALVHGVSKVNADQNAR